MSVDTQLDYLWVLVCAALVFIMQTGLMRLESGLTRRKNSINVAIKNLADFCVTTVVFGLVGYGILFGTSHAGWFETDRIALDLGGVSAEGSAFFLFHVVFCGAAVTIMSGAVAERVRLSSYLFVAFLVSGVVYPLFGHWAKRLAVSTSRHFRPVQRGNPLAWRRCAPPDASFRARAAAAPAARNQHWLSDLRAARSAPPR